MLEQNNWVGLHHFAKCTVKCQTLQGEGWFFQFYFLIRCPLISAEALVFVYYLHFRRGLSKDTSLLGFKQVDRSEKRHVLA